MKTFTAFTQAARQIIFNKIRMIFCTFLTNNFDSDCTCCVSCKNDTMICFHDPYMENGSLAWRDTRWDHLFSQDLRCGKPFRSLSCCLEYLWTGCKVHLARPRQKTECIAQTRHSVYRYNISRRQSKSLFLPNFPGSRLM